MLEKFVNEVISSVPYGNNIVISPEEETIITVHANIMGNV